MFMVNFDGIYFCDTTNGRDLSVDAMRFFEDGKVVYVGISLTKKYKNLSNLAEYIKTWFNREYVNNGMYYIQGNKITFTMNFERGMIIDYEGTIFNKKLLLKWQENVNANYKIIEDEYIFYRFKNKKLKTDT
jgi:hypothetical protein